MVDKTNNRYFITAEEKTKEEEYAATIQPRGIAFWLVDNLCDFLDRYPVPEEFEIYEGIIVRFCDSEGNWREEIKKSEIETKTREELLQTRSELTITWATEIEKQLKSVFNERINYISKDEALTIFFKGRIEFRTPTYKKMNPTTQLPYLYKNVDDFLSYNSELINKKEAW